MGAIKGVTGLAKKALFIEVKRPGQKPSKLQEYRMKELNNHGIKTEVHTG